MLDLDELERIGKAADDAPWTVDDLGEQSFLETNHRHGIGAVSHDCYRLAKVEGAGYTAEANADFIATARNNWQALIDEVRRLTLCLDDIVRAGTVKHEGYNEDDMSQAQATCALASLGLVGPEIIAVTLACARRREREAAPTWQDRPTCPGLWLWRYENGEVYARHYDQWEVDRMVSDNVTRPYRYYGPIPT